MGHAADRHGDRVAQGIGDGVGLGDPGGAAVGRFPDAAVGAADVVGIPGRVADVGDRHGNAARHLGVIDAVLPGDVDPLRADGDPLGDAVGLHEEGKRGLREVAGLIDNLHADRDRPRGGVGEREANVAGRIPVGDLDVIGTAEAIVERIELDIGNPPQADVVVDDADDGGVIGVRNVADVDVGGVADVEAGQGRFSVVGDLSVKLDIIDADEEPALIVGGGDAQANRLAGEGGKVEVLDGAVEREGGCPRSAGEFVAQHVAGDGPGPAGAVAGVLVPLSEKCVLSMTVIVNVPLAAAKPVLLSVTRLPVTKVLAVVVVTTMGLPPAPTTEATLPDRYGAVLTLSIDAPGRHDVDTNLLVGMRIIGAVVERRIGGRVGVGARLGVVDVEAEGQDRLGGAGGDGDVLIEGVRAFVGGGAVGIVVALVGGLVELIEHARNLPVGEATLVPLRGLFWPVCGPQAPWLPPMPALRSKVCQPSRFPCSPLRSRPSKSPLSTRFELTTVPPLEKVS